VSGEKRSGVWTTSPGERIWRADATVYIEAGTHDEAQGQMMDWVAERMPSNFVIGWTLIEEAA
jgi:hypothetical protein